MSLSGESFSRECGSFSRGVGEGRGREKRRRILPRTGGKVSLAYHPSRAASSLLLLRLLFHHLASAFFMFSPFLHCRLPTTPPGSYFCQQGRRKVTDIFLWSALWERGVWKLLNARNARFNWYESRIYFRDSLCKRD